VNFVYQDLPASCKDAIVRRYWTFLGGKKGCGRVSHVDELHNAAEVFGKVFEFVYEDPSLNVFGVEQVSEGWTWVILRTQSKVSGEWQDRLLGSFGDERIDIVSLPSPDC